MSVTIFHDRAENLAALLEPESIQTVITSPPYYGLRDYGAEGQIGLEETPEEYVTRLVDVFRGVRKVLRPDGTLWLNLGDSYNGSGGAGGDYYPGGLKEGQPRYPGRRVAGLKPKDLIGIPWRVAFALQAAGWYLRSDIIWCLSGGTRVYARTQKGDMPMTIKDLARLDPYTVQLWNGERWTQLLGMSQSDRKGDEITLVLRSGERISCTPTHKFPTGRGLLEAKYIAIGDELQTCMLPEPDEPKFPVFVGEDVAWLAGLYVAEGSRSGDTIQIAGNANEVDRWERLCAIAAAYGGYATCTIDGNNMNVRLYGKFLNALIDEFVSGRTAKDKHFAPVVWRYSNKFLAAMVDGYLSGDGHFDSLNNRWRLGFTRNYNLEADLRTACARLGYRLTLNLAHASYNGKRVPVLRGEIRKSRSGHWNEKNLGEVVAIEKSRCRQVWDLGVADGPHLFALASGVLTHNSKPNPMPESVTDRPTKAHEYVFLLTKEPRYYYNNEAIQERATTEWTFGQRDRIQRVEATGGAISGGTGELISSSPFRNKRSVWTIPTQPFPEAHFATFPERLPELCILAGSKRGDLVLDPFVGSGTTLLAAERLVRRGVGTEINTDYIDIAKRRLSKVQLSMQLEGSA